MRTNSFFGLQSSSTCSSHRQANMECATKEIFYKELNTLKQNKKRKDSLITLFIEDQFYNEAKEFLKGESEKHSDLSTSQATTCTLQHIMTGKSKPATKK